MAEVKRALISVSDKTGIAEFARELSDLGVEVLSTGGTARALKEAGVPVRPVSDFTGFPEMLDGRVKTLHPRIHAGLLARRSDTGHMEEMKKHGLELIDLVVVNLYPFSKTIAREGVSLEEAVEQIDIGGPTMLRSAAKNYESVAVVVNPARYEQVLEELKKNKGEIGESLRKALALEVFQHTSAYDTAISAYLGKRFSAGAPEDELPPALDLHLEKVGNVRYGENPHQKAAYYREEGNIWGLGKARQLHGKELSFNNFLDLEAALVIATEFEEPAASVIKHTNPCGAAHAPNLAEAYRDALACDPVSAFGSVVGLNRRVDPETARRIDAAPFVEAIIAPGFEKEALDILQKKKNLRLLELEGYREEESPLDVKLAAGVVLVQERDRRGLDTSSLRVVTRKKPSDEDLKFLVFAWRICKFVKSNAIVLVQGTRTVGIGAGQMSRVDSTIIALRKAGEHSKDSVLASDAFFPFPDAVEEAGRGGVRAIIQPGGAQNDPKVIEAADKAGIAMVLTGMRHFRH